MRNSLRRFIREAKYFLRRYRFEAIVAAVTLLVSVISIMPRLSPLMPSQEQWVPFFVDCITVFLLLVLLFNLKRLFDSRFHRINRTLIDHLGLSWEPTQYSVRLQHFPGEKKRLAEVLVKRILPGLIDQARVKHQGLVEVRVLLDSGTTITPCFTLLARQGLGIPDGVTLEIYTNNLAGIDEMRKLDPQRELEITERRFNLIGGRPLPKYRATTGAVTQRLLRELWKEQEERETELVTIGVLTANWFIASRGLDRVALCARGTGHFDFKRSIVDNATYLCLVAPLGKILPIQDVADLNKYIAEESDSEDTYECYPVPGEKKERTYLLTSYRPRDTLSPLVHSSALLQKIAVNQEGHNYQLCAENPIYDPTGSKEEVERTELPHGYIRRSFKDIFG